MPQPISPPSTPAGPTQTDQSPQQIVDGFYKWIFQVKLPLPWQEVLKQRREDLSDTLWALLRAQSLRPNSLEFDPFLDSEGGAAGYHIESQAQRGPRAMVSVKILGAASGVGKRDRLIVLELQRNQSGWVIANIFYQWAQQEDLMSICRQRN